MQNLGLVKLGLVAMLAASLVACKSKTAPETTAPAVAPSGNGNAAANNGALSAAEQARRDALAKTTFYFEFDKAELSQADRDALVYHAAELKNNPNSKIRLEGHADERGTREYNLALGERRAQAVQSYLQVQGVGAGQMETVSYGEERPAQTGTTEAAYSANRRVEMKK